MLKLDAKEQKKLSLSSETLRNLKAGHAVATLAPTVDYSCAPTL